VEDVYKPDLVKESIEVFGADDPAHPSVAYLRSRVQDFYIGGKVQAIKLPTHFDYAALRCKFFISLTLFVKVNISSRYTFRTSCSIQKTFMEKGGCISNSQSHASSTP
jgi:sulfate adenylyltransferase